MTQTDLWPATTAPTQLSWKAWALYSGGKDSTVLAHRLASQNALAGCVAFDTGISTPDWKDYVTEACRVRGWPLKIYATSKRYEDLVQKFSFPTPRKHGLFMNYLKGRGLRQFKAEHPGVLIASGVRQGESKRRLAHVREWDVIEGMPIWAPLWNWTTEQTWAYMRQYGLTRSPAYTTLGISGDCLCGAFASQGERETIQTCYPDVWARLAPLEAALGSVWGQRPSGGQSRSKLERMVCIECDPSGTPESGTR